MGVTDSISDTNEKAVEIGEKYINTSIKYYKLRFFKQLAISVSMVFKGMFIGGLALMGLLLFSFAFAILIGKSTGNYYLGFLLVGVVFVVLALIGYLFRDYINKLVIKKLSKKFFN